MDNSNQDHGNANQTQGRDRMDNIKASEALQAIRLDIVKNNTHTPDIEKACQAIMTAEDILHPDDGNFDAFFTADIKKD